jgi:hypothetical protein
MRQTATTFAQGASPIRPDPALRLQRKCGCGGSAGPAGECPECQKKRLGLQRKAIRGDGLFEAPRVVHEVLRTPGQPLERGLLASMEERFGHDFSRVRVHADSRATTSAQAVDALAYTVGNHMVFQSGLYRPESSSGQQLLAHELTHVVQQAGGTGAAAGPVRVTPAGHSLLSRQIIPYPGTIGRCRGLGVPCPAPYAHHGTVCRLVDCIPAASARLPFAISPGICIYHCLDGNVCACVLVGSSTSAVCTFTFCDYPGQASLDGDYQDLADRAVAAATQELGETASGAPEEGLA